MSAAINLGLVREQVEEQVWVRGGGKPSETLRAEQRKRHSAAGAAEQPAGAAECRLNTGRGSEADAKNNCVHDNSSDSAEQRVEVESVCYGQVNLPSRVSIFRIILRIHRQWKPKSQLLIKNKTCEENTFMPAWFEKHTHTHGCMHIQSTS